MAGRLRDPWLTSRDDVARSVTFDSESIKRYGDSMSWLTLLTALPPSRPDTASASGASSSAWAPSGCAAPGWMLPETPETTELFQWLVQEIQSFRGEATLLRVDRVETMSDEVIAGMFHKARNPEYQAVVQGSREILAQLDRYRTSHRGSIPALRAMLDGLKRELDRDPIDRLSRGAGRASAPGALGDAAKRLRASETRPRATGGRHRTSLPAAGSTWVTRPRPHIDRIASAWLIKRFCDPQAKFAFADAAEFPVDAGGQGGDHRRLRAPGQGSESRRSRAAAARDRRDGDP